MAAANRQDRVTAMQNIQALLPKLDDPDPDIRFMQLNDLAAILLSSNSEQMRNDTHAAARVIDRIIKALTDSNGEVQNQALKWYVKRICSRPSTNTLQCRPASEKNTQRLRGAILGQDH